jgi:hypothetical protein
MFPVSNILNNKSLDTGISLHGGPFQLRRTWYVGGGAHILGTLIDERRRALVVGHLSASDFLKETLRESPLLGNPKDEVFGRYAKCPVNGPLSPSLSLSP